MITLYVVNPNNAAIKVVDYVNQTSQFAHNVAAKQEATQNRIATNKCETALGMKIGRVKSNLRVNIQS